jgi:DNA-binding winged helix-turn-helix (wHTH) protein
VRAQHGRLASKGIELVSLPVRGRRSDAAATHADHPKVLGIKEERLLEPMLDFLSRRIFSADRLRLLRDELAASTWEEHAVEASRLEAELSKVNRSLRVVPNHLRQ